MMNPECPLRYKISNWHQLSKCKSNNSRDLEIIVSDYINNDKLTGLRISVIHKNLGVLFATVLDADGLIVTHIDEISDNLSNATILKELQRYGFLITYDESFNLPSAQIEYLITLQALGFDKLRILTVVNHHSNQAVNKVVAFQVNPLGDWLNNAYDPSESEFLAALDAGTAINLTDISKTKDFRWDWLYGKVVSIEDVIEDNISDSSTSSGGV